MTSLFLKVLSCSTRVERERSMHLNEVCVFLLCVMIMFGCVVWGLGDFARPGPIESDLSISMRYVTMYVLLMFHEHAWG